MEKPTKIQEVINQRIEGLKIISFVYDVKTETTIILYEVLYNKKWRNSWSKYTGKPEMTGRKLSTTKKLKDFMKLKGGIAE